MLEMSRLWVVPRPSRGLVGDLRPFQTLHLCGSTASRPALLVENYPLRQPALHEEKHPDEPQLTSTTRLLVSPVESSIYGVSRLHPPLLVLVPCLDRVIRDPVGSIADDVVGLHMSLGVLCSCPCPGDRVLPTCGRCRSTGRECIKGYKFKLARHDAFDQSQKWPRPPKRLKFVHESGLDDVAPELGSELELTRGVDAWPAAAAVTAPAGESRPAYHEVNVMNTAQHLALGDRREEGQYRSGSSASREPAADLTQAIAQETYEQSHPQYDPAIKANIYLDKPVWPISRRDEAILFRHYIQRLAIWLDLCDPLTHFQTSVPSRAGTCPILLNAIFALSARHLSHTTSRYDALASNRYHEQCLKYLIPLLDHAVTVSDENLFAATIILRVLEEMDVPTLGQDTHGHLLGIHAFVAAPASTPSSVHASAANSPSLGAAPSAPPPRRILPNSLHAACFWVGLRQEIYSAVMNQQAVRMNLAHSGIVDRSTSPADDFAWGNRAVVHCADVLNYCFGDSAGAARDAARWDDLARANRDWKAHLPESYMPLFYRDRRLPDDAADDIDVLAAFPEVWYMKGCHIIAVQHHILAELYLALFDPSHPRTGLLRRPAEDALASRARNLVRNLCGIGVCNQWCPPAMFTACMGIAAAGDRFDDRAQQDALLEVLRITELDHGRPTTAVRAQLRGCWGREEV